MPISPCSGALPHLPRAQRRHQSPSPARAEFARHYGHVDVGNNDGFISGDEWNTYRTSSYGFWDVNHDGRISRSEFERCYRAGGFYRDAYYNPDYWTNYWTGFDANGDGYLSADEYWSTNSWARIYRTQTDESIPINGCGGHKDCP